MASINMIFDEGEADSEPEAEHRDYDLVIELTSHNVNNKTDDVTEGNKRVYFARNPDKSIRSFSITVEGKTYQYAVRYKYRYNSGTQNNKVHVKYIPLNHDDIPLYLNHFVKSFIDNPGIILNTRKCPIGSVSWQRKR